MDNDTLTNYLNDARLNQAEFTMLENLNNRILRKCNNNMRKLKYAIDYVQDSTARTNPNMSRRNRTIIGDYLRKVRNYSVDNDFEHDMRSYYNEFEL